MKAVDQTQFIGQGVGGDCVRASVASILELPIEEVPHFLEIAPTPSEWGLAFEDWMDERGLYVWLKHGHLIFDGYYLVSGPSPRGVSHMVVYRDGALAHDPHPSRAGILSVDWTRILVPLDPSVAIKRPDVVLAAPRRA